MSFCLLIVPFWGGGGVGVAVIFAVECVVVYCRIIPPSPISPRRGGGGDFSHPCPGTFFPTSTDFVSFNKRKNLLSFLY